MSNFRNFFILTGDLDSLLQSLAHSDDAAGECRFWRRPQGEKMEILSVGPAQHSTQLKAIDFGDKEVS